MTNLSVTGGTIVCGISGTDADNVLDAALWLADGYNGQLVVVHAFDEPVVEAEHVMVGVRRRAARHRRVETRLIQGSPAARLLEVAQQEAAQFLVLGSRGRGAIPASVLGSVSRELTKSAVCPLVVVPPNAESVAESRGGEGAAIVFGVDGSQHALATAVVAGELAERLGFRVVVVHAPRDARSLVTYVGRSTTPSLSVQPDEAARRTQEIVQEAVAAVGDRATSARVEAGPPDRVLKSVAEQENGKMIVIAARGVGAVHAALLGSVADSLVRSSDVPVVIVPERAATRPSSASGSESSREDAELG